MMKRNNGFTLIELLTVIGILGIICLIATPIILGIMEETKKDVFHTSVLSLVNATKMDIGNKYYEEEFIYTLENGVIDNIEFPVSNAEGMYGMIEYDEDSKVQYAVHNGKYCVKKMNYMDKAKIFNYEGVCDFSTSEDCFEFENGTITDYYEYEKNNENNDICPRKVIIPGTIDEKTVTAIGANAFKEKELISVEFPATITNIGNYAFAYNKLSGELDLSHLSGLKSINSYVFEGNSDGSTNQISSLKLPNSVTSIGHSAFRYNKLSGELDLSHLTSLTTISYCVFGGSSDGSTNQITSVKLPNSLINVYGMAFEYNKLSGELDLSHLIKLKGISESLFRGTVNGSTNQITSLKLPNSITGIGNFAFEGHKLNDLDLSYLTNLTSIGHSAFNGSNDKDNRQVTNFKLPSSVTSINRYAFNNCKISGELDLSYLTGWTSTGWDVFSYNKISKVILPTSITTINQSAFAHNKLSGELDLSHLTNLTTIGDYAFAGATDGSTNQLTSLKLPDSTITIGAGAFSYNKLSGELDFSNCLNLTTIGISTFAANQLTSLIIPSSVTGIGMSAFGINQLTSVTFYGRSDLTGISMGPAPWGWASGYNNSNIYYVNE